MIILTDAKKKGFNKIQYSFIKKKKTIFSKPEIEINVLNLMKDIYKNPTTDITLNDENQSFPLRSGRRQAHPSPHYFSMSYWKYYLM